MQKLLKRAQQHVNFLHKLMDFQTHQNLPLPPGIAIMMTALESPNLGQARQFSPMQMDLHCVMVSVQTGLVFVFLLWDAIIESMSFDRHTDKTEFCQALNEPENKNGHSGDMAK